MCHEKEKKYADMLWSDFYFQMTVLLTTIHIIHIYNQDTKKKKNLNLPKSVYFNKCIKLYCVPLHLKIKEELRDL